RPSFHGILWGVPMRRRAVIIASLAAVAFSGCVVKTPSFGEAATAEQERGISKERLARIETVLQEEVDMGARAGFVVAVGHNGRAVYASAVGLADIDGGVPMTQETRFRIASMTKPVVTFAMMRLVEEGKV